MSASSGCQAIPSIRPRWRMRGRCIEIYLCHRQYIPSYHMSATHFGNWCVCVCARRNAAVRVTYDTFSRYNRDNGVCAVAEMMVWAVQKIHKGGVLNPLKIPFNMFDKMNISEVIHHHHRFVYVVVVVSVRMCVCGHDRDSVLEWMWLSSTIVSSSFTIISPDLLSLASWSKWLGNLMRNPSFQPKII